MPAQLPLQQSASARFGGLDGLRAVAVGLVLVYHLFPTVLPGGFLGVDVFFTISGFLITSLLLRELDGNGKIDLLDFWRRRARRLLPALALVLLVSTSLARLVGGDLLVGIGKQIAGAAFFVSNWVYIAMGSDYFTRDNPELFRNTWSLAIEEQFYILLPLLLLLLFRLRGRRGRAIVLLALGLLSAGWMAVLSLLGADPTRIYFGSDTHTFGLLLGAGAAALLHRGEVARAPGVGRQLGYLVAAIAGFSVLAGLSFTLPEGSPESFRGGFQLATLAALGIVCAVTRPGAWVGRALDVQPLRWVGERSYGIYLWHWPLLVVLGAAFAGVLPDWGVSVAALLSTLVLATLSYRFIEVPIRRIGLIRATRRVFAVTSQAPRQRAIAVSLAAVLLLTVPATAMAVATAPALSSSAAAIARGQAELDRQAEAAEAGSRGDGANGAGGADGASGASGADKADTADKSDAAPSAGAGEGSAAKPAPPIVFEGGDITAVGDSVMLASLPELSVAFPGISIDAAVSRGFGAGVEVFEDIAAQGSMRRVLVAGLGTNGAVEPEDLESLRKVAGDRAIVLVNASGDRDWIPGVNQQLNDFAAANTGVVVADWAGSVDGVADALAGDGIHPNPSGGEIYAAAVQRALDELQTPTEALGYGVPRR